MTTDSLAKEVIAGSSRALGQAISRIERQQDGYQSLLSTLHRESTPTHVIGVTGSPGVGKSTLVGALTSAYRAENLSVGIIGVDPTSPITGGAILGDRVRIADAASDPGVFVRSMSTHGTLGGLSPATGDVITAYEAFGMDRIIVETVGAGQNEIDVVRTADSVVLVLQPSSGDDVQMLKAGILEIGDIFIVNKADTPGVDRTVRDLREMLTHTTDEHTWTPPIIEAVATEATGIDSFVSALSSHYEYLTDSGELEHKRRARYIADIHRIINAEVNERITNLLQSDEEIDRMIDRLMNRELDTHTAVNEILERIELIHST